MVRGYMKEKGHDYDVNNDDVFHIMMDILDGAVVSGRKAGERVFIWGKATPEIQKIVRKMYPSVTTIYQTEPIEAIEEAVGSSAGHGYYYHGTYGDKGRQILKDGYVNPPDIGKRRAALTPRKGMVYLASNIEYALAFALGGATEGYDFSKYADNWWWQNKGEAAIVRVKAEDMQEAEPDEDDIANIIMAHERDDKPEKKALADHIFSVYVKGNRDLESKWRELKGDPALHKAVRVVKHILKKMPRYGAIWNDIKKLVDNAAHPGRVKVHDVLLFKASDITQIPRPKDGYTFDLIAQKIGDVEKPQIQEATSSEHKLPAWFSNGTPVSKEELENVAPDTPYILEGDEFDYAWRLCDVPVEALGVDPEAGDRKSVV